MTATDAATRASAPRERTTVLFIAHDAGLFGAQRALLTLIEGLDRSAFECHVVSPDDGPFVDAVRRLNYPVHLRKMIRWVPAVRQVEAASGRLGYARKCLTGLRDRSWSIAALIERHGIRVVYTNTVTCVEGAIAARMASIPHVWYITEPIFANPELCGIVPGIVYRSAIAALSREVVFCSRSLAADYGRLQHRSRVVYPGLPLPQPRDRANARAALLTQLGLPRGNRLVGVVAALQPRKDHATFLTAAKRVAERCADVAFLIVGSGQREYAAELDDRINSLGLAGVTRVLGWWPSEIHDFLAGLDVLVISSIQESFGLTAIEALAVETPVVSTRCGGPSEVIRDGVDGRLVPVGDAESMARAIDEMLQDPSRAQALALSGRDRAAKTFTVEHYVKGIEEIIRGCR